MSEVTALAGAIRVFLALVFLAAAFPKLRHQDAFRGALEDYRLLPGWAITPVQQLLPLLEVAIALCLLALPRPASLAAAMLLLLFAGAMSINILRGRSHIDCGCGQSAFRQTLRWRFVGRNVALAALAGAAAVPPPSGDAALTILGVPGGVCLFLIYSAINTLLAFEPGLRRHRIRIVGGAS